MIERPSRQRPDGCISDLEFDRLFAAELTSDEQRELVQHVQGCARCASRRAELERLRAGFLAAAPAWAPPGPAATVHRPRRWLAPVAAGLALAAAVMLAVLPRGAEPSTRTKGAPRISFFVKQGERVWRGSSGERVQPGAQLRFTYSTAVPKHLAILSLDGAQRASVYFPAGPRSEQLPAGTDRPLGSAVELDATLGEEHIIALFCAAPIDLEAQRVRLARERLAFAAPTGCATHELTIHKQPGSP